MDFDAFSKLEERLRGENNLDDIRDTEAGNNAVPSKSVYGHDLNKIGMKKSFQKSATTYSRLI